MARLKGYYGPREVELGLINAILRGERPQGMGREFIIDDEDPKRKKAQYMGFGSVGPTGMLPSGYSGPNSMGYE